MLFFTTASRIIKFYDENSPTYDHQTLRGFFFYATILPCRYQPQRAEVVVLIYITGDTHGEFGRIEKFCSRFAPSRDDTMIILGDAGMNFYGGFRDRFKKEWLSQLPLTIFSIHGNHEMRPGTIASYHITEWRGGKVYVEDDFPNLLFAVDGEIYDLDGIRAIAIGGAYSIDKAFRLIHGYGWWPDEQPSPAIKEKVESTLAENGWKVDVVLSHTTPLKYEPVEAFLPSIDQSKVDKNTETWLDGIEDRLDYQHWYCGHYHIEKDIDRLSIMFESIREFGEWRK